MLVFLTEGLGSRSIIRKGRKVSTDSPDKYPISETSVIGSAHTNSLKNTI